MVKMRSDGMEEKPIEEIVFPSIHVDEAEDLTFLDVLLIITQRKKLVGIVIALCTTIGLILAFALPQEYTATVTILPPQGGSSMSSMLASQLSGMSGAMGGMASSMLGMKNINEMYVSMLKSQSVKMPSYAAMGCSRSTARSTWPTRARLSRVTRKSMDRRRMG